MAQDDCLGEGNKKWTSEFKPTGSASFTLDSMIEIKKVSNKLKGKHEKTGAELENLDCDGTNISFDRLETKGEKQIRVFYKNGKITGPTAGKFHINGKYEERELPSPADDRRAAPTRGKSGTKGIPDFVNSDTGDWHAEKPTA